MRHGSLFSGIGGFDLAAQWMGWENVFHCEWNPFGQKVLKHYWPNATSYNDITTTDFTIHRGSIDILTGGFPCQPYSNAGKRKGKEDERHLWPQMLRAIREIQPRYVLGENVRGLTNWNGGLVFDEVQSDLENQGFEVLPFLLPACAVNAPHRRDRIWFVAYSDKCAKRPSGKSGGIIGGRGNNNDEQKERREQPEQYNGFNHVLQTFTDSGLLRPEKCEKQTTGIKQCDKGDDTNPDCNGCDKCNCNNEKHTSKGGFDALNEINESSKISLHSDSSISQGKYIGQEGQRKFDRSNCGNGINDWENFPTQSPICLRNDGLSFRLDGITFPKWREQSIMAAGNAIVPQVALQIFKAIQETDI